MAELGRGCRECMFKSRLSYREKAGASKVHGPLFLSTLRSLPGCIVKKSTSVQSIDMIFERVMAARLFESDQCFTRV